MKLHLDKAAFEYIIDEVATKFEVRRDVLEKDYYVTLLLNELANLPHQGYAYFKGCTALYKALRSIRRFSEDIDLTVFIEDCLTPSRAKKRLENAALKYKSMAKGDTLENIRGSITTEYCYESMYELDASDALQRFGKVKVEATSFTVSEPTEKITVSPYLYDLCDEDRRTILREQYDVQPFEVETISLERIFIDKVFAAEFYFVRKDFSDVAKHVYDLTVLMKKEQIQTFLENKEEVGRIVGLKRKEELSRKGGVDEQKEIVDFEYFTALKNSKAFEESLANMQKIYVFDKNDVLRKEDIFSALDALRGAMVDVK